MFNNCANNPIYIPNGGECDDCSQLESRVDNLEEAMTEVQEELPDKQDKLTAGEGIFITPDGIISTTSSMTRVTITGTDPYYSSDMTFSEILSAYNNGNAVIANYNGQMLTLQSIDGSEAVFASTDDNGYITFFTITNGNTISSSVMTVSEMVGATAATDGEGGTVPAPEAGDEEKFLKGDGTWAEVSGGCCAEEVSGNPIILTDAKNMNAQSLEVDFEPIQDLNGYDHAWAGGNGKNLWPTYQTSTSGGVTFTANADGGVVASGKATATVNLGQTFKPPTTGTYTISGCPSGGGANSYQLWIYNVTDAVSTNITDTGSGGSGMLDASKEYSLRIRYANGYTAGQTFYPQIEHGATATPYEPYSNICPINGAESVTVKRTGKNLLEPFTFSTTNAGITYTADGSGSISASGTATSNAYINLYNWVPLRSTSLAGMAGQNVAINGGTSDVRFSVAFRKSAGVDETTAHDNGGGATITIPTDLDYQVYVALRVVSGKTVNTTIYPMIRPASISDSTYEPYNSQTVSINLGGEYYGGTLDVTTGELDVLWKAFTFDGSSDEEWSQEAVEEGTTPTWPLSHGIELEGVDATVKPYCATFNTKVGTVAESEWAMVGVYSPSYPSNRTYLDVRPAVDYSTGNAWRDYLDANPLTVVAKLKEPIKVQLVSAQLELLEKYNVLTTNGELITLSYMPDCYCGVTRTSQLLGLTHIMDGKANGSLRSNTAFPDGVIEQGGQSVDGTLGNYATALGAETMATGMGAFAHGMMAMASGTCAHAEGAGTAATGGGSHSEGEQTVASGARSHAEGLMCTASGSESHASGASSEASAAGAFVHGQGLKASSPLQTVFGKYNVEDSNSEYAFIIGNGTSNNRSNLFAIKWDGTVEINGQALLPANGNSF